MTVFEDRGQILRGIHGKVSFTLAHLLKHSPCIAVTLCPGTYTGRITAETPITFYSSIWSWLVTYLVCLVSVLCLVYVCLLVIDISVFALADWCVHTAYIPWSLSPSPPLFSQPAPSHTGFGFKCSYGGALVQNSVLSVSLLSNWIGQEPNPISPKVNIEPNPWILVCAPTIFRSYPSPRLPALLLSSSCVTVCCITDFFRYCLWQLWVWVLSLHMISSRFTLVPAYDQISFCLRPNNAPLWLYTTMPRFLYPFSCWWASSLGPCLGYHDLCHHT